MRRIAALALPALLLAGLLPDPARAQMWPNEVGPRRDMQELALRPLQRLQPPPPAAPAAFLPPPAAPLPVWTQAPPTQAAPRRIARATPRPAAQNQAQSQPATLTANGIGELEQRLAGREKQLEEMRRQIETDRRSLQDLRTASGSSVKSTPSVSSTIQ
ncbi:hypothetical protein RQ831_04750 [Roseomonas gilardii]|uniref:Uncharacterized protein n=1 Tax=Roseomonas gilardii TaxID=257708 RepID=A0ABU3MBR8_9PROT|nr:hypothetical protein [Roseomonas gilardii]MDT8330351.1 hypothetical protein [Roseomonas gilardii]PZR12427.1 MAG: hypothetical protein DI532_13575 [Azospirillum brasilense]